MLDKLITLSRRNKKLVMLSVDSVLLVSVILLSFSIRLGHFYLPEIGLIYWVVFGAPIVAIPIFVRFGLYNTVIRYIGFKALWAIVQAVSLYVLVLGLLGYMTAVGYIAEVEGIIRSLIFINWLLALVAIGGSRMTARWLLSGADNRRTSTEYINVIIYGAGSAGRQLSIALTQSSDYKPVAFIDNNAELVGQSINGINVVSRGDLAHLIETKNVTEVLLAIPSLSRLQRNEIVNYLQPFAVLVRSLPSVSELAQGKVSVSDLLEIDLRDLLGREPVKPNAQLLKTNITNQVVMVTGAGGSIGSELSRQVVSLKPKKIVLFDISESSLYLINQELISIGVPNVEIVPVIGSVADRDRMEYICNYYVVKTIYHAAAYKHVPLVEFNPSQGILNNSIGTMIAAQAAIAAEVDTFVLISTDKAVRPTNVMGASKRIAELILQALDRGHHDTCFTMVRFGNVLDSSGSVIPLFKKQIQAGGPVTVTHSNVVRYFMTIPEAVELVIQAGAMAKGGEVFVLDMGEPIRIHDLAVKMIQLSGLVVRDENNSKGDIEIQYTGLRPGEKLYEELLVDGSFSMTKNKLIRRAEEGMIDWDQLEPMLMKIEKASKSVGECNDNDKLYPLIRELVPLFNPQANGFDNEHANTADTK